MGLFDKFFGKKEEPKVEPKPKKARKPKEAKVELSAKEKATMANEPYINIVKMSVDPNDIHNGEFELDYNEKFVINLIKAGYKMKEDETDTIVVDRWFQTICRNVALEMYEQNQADPSNRDLRNVVSRDIGNGRTEVS
jgi:TPP-dependent 2-oxoacid decarboxylase